jgi:hypothetical protein
MFDSPTFAAGSYEIDARRLGYKPVRSRVMVLQGDTAEVLLAMLAGMKVTETAAQLHLREFEARLRNHTGGYFITDSVIRIHDPEGIQALLHARVPGIRVEVPYQGKIVAYSTRGQTSLKDTGKCIVGVFVDGIRMGDGDAGVVPLFDLAGIEYYPPSLAPVQYRIPPPVAGAGGRRAELLRAACFSSGLVLSARLERRHVGARRMPLIRL